MEARFFYRAQRKALSLLGEREFDVSCALMLPTMSGFNRIEKARSRHLPIIVYTAKDLSAKEEKTQSLRTKRDCERCAQPEVSSMSPLC